MYCHKSIKLRFAIISMHMLYVEFQLIFLFILSLSFALMQKKQKIKAAYNFGNN
jgi:hypothetical protein